MTATRLGSVIEHSFAITGEAELPDVFNPADGMFVPVIVTVYYKDGEFDRVNVGGPKLNKAGKQLKQYGWVTWDLDYLDPDDDFYIPEGQEMPEWVRVLVRNVMRNPFAQPGDTIDEAGH